MADKKDSNETPKEGEKKVKVEGEATVEGSKGTEHEVDFDARATVRSISDKQTGGATAGEPCIECGEPTLANRRCINPECSVAQEQSSKAADRPTAKATAPAPRAVAMSGRPD